MGYLGNCPQCGNKYLLRPANAVVYVFTEERWLSYAWIYCNKCEEGLSLWCEADDLEGLIAEGIETITAPFASQTLRDEWSRRYWETPIMHQLTKVEEDEVKFWHYLLGHVRTARSFLRKCGVK